MGRWDSRQPPEFQRTRCRELQAHPAPQVNHPVIKFVGVQQCFLFSVADKPNSVYHSFPASRPQSRPQSVVA